MASDTHFYLEPGKAKDLASKTFNQHYIKESIPDVDFAQTVEHASMFDVDKDGKVDFDKVFKLKPGEQAKVKKPVPHGYHTDERWIITGSRFGNFIVIESFDWRFAASSVYTIIEPKNLPEEFRSVLTKLSGESRINWYLGTGSEKVNIGEWFEALAERVFLIKSTVADVAEILANTE